MADKPDLHAAFEKSERAKGRPLSALYRTPAGDYEDEDVAKAWALWQSLSTLAGVKSLGWAESARRNPAYRY